MSRSYQDPRLMYPCQTDISTGDTTFLLPNGKTIMFHQEYIEDYPERVCEHLNIAAIGGKEMARHPKYTAEAARLKPKTAGVKDYSVDWVDPRGLSYLASAAERKAADEKIRKEYDDLFWSTTSPGLAKSMRDAKDKAVAAVWSTHSDPTSWDYVPYEFAKKELPMNPFLDKVVKMEYVGSRVTCNPPPTDTDEDVLLLTDDLTMLIADCIEVGFTRDGDHTASYPTGFVSLRNGTMNFIVTDDEEFYKKFMLATHVCKSLNVMDKSNRIVVFQAILYDNAAPASIPVEEVPF